MQPSHSAIAARSLRTAAIAIMASALLCFVFAKGSGRTDDLAKVAAMASAGAKAYRATGLPWVATDVQPTVRPDQNAWPLIEKVDSSRGQLGEPGERANPHPEKSLSEQLK